MSHNRCGHECGGGACQACELEAERDRLTTVYGELSNRLAETTAECERLRAELRAEEELRAAAEIDAAGLRAELAQRDAEIAGLKREREAAAELGYHG